MSLNDTERELLWQEVEQRRDELIALVADLIRIPNENPGGSQREAVDYVKGYLTEAGFTWQEVGENQEFPCLVAQAGNPKGQNLLINGHVDVVPAGDRGQWKFDPFGGQVTEDQILGRGTSDMKAGLACALFAARILAEKGFLEEGCIRFHVVSDEESGGQFGSGWLCANGYAKGVDACLVAEPTSMTTIEIGQKGGLVLTLEARGVSAHGSIGNYKGENAILRLGKVLEHIEMLTQVQGHFTEKQKRALADSKAAAEREIGVPGVGEVIDHVTANVGLISGGSRHNMVPDTARAVVDVRLPIGVDTEEVEEQIKRMIETSGESKVSYHCNWTSLGNYTDDDSLIVRAVKENAEAVVGEAVIPSYQWASSDAKHYRAAGVPTIQYGPSNTEGIHSYNETVQIKDVVNTAKIYTTAFLQVLRAE